MVTGGFDHSIARIHSKNDHTTVRRYRSGVITFRVRFLDVFCLIDPRFQDQLVVLLGA